MPKIPLNQKPFVNVESIGNANAIEFFADMVKDDFMNNRTRPGLGGAVNNAFADLGSGAKIDGMWYIRDINVVAVVSAGKLYKVESSGVVTEITGVATLTDGTTASFAEYSSKGYFCANSAIIEWDYTGNTYAVLADPQAPTDATFIAVIDGYLVALRNDSARFEWSNVDAPTVWDGEFATAEFGSDNAQALLTHYGTMFIPGEVTTEHWTTTGDTTTPFQRLSGAVSERGCIAKYSVTAVDNTYFYMDNERRVIRLTGYQPSIISNPYDKDFQGLTDVANAIGYHCNAMGLTWYVLTFPTSQETYFYDYKLDYWGKLSFWDADTLQRRHFLGLAGVWVDKWNKFLIGSRVDGEIYCMDYDYATDNGLSIISEVITGRIDWGTNQKKESQRLRVRVKRGHVASGSLFVSYRDNGNSEWSNEKEVELGPLGDEETVVNFRQLGWYYDRQWRFRSDSAVTIVSAEEDIQVIA